MPVRSRVILLSLFAVALWSAPVFTQEPGALGWAARVTNDYRMVPNITYLTANNWDAKVDLYLPRAAKGPTPTMLFIHGGGWVGGTKEDVVLNLLPYLEMGLAIVNVEYRLARVSLAPAAVEDCRCALRWVISHAKEYNFDTTKLVVAGTSAGGHLALTTGMIPSSAGLDRQCPGTEELKVAAIINWYGISDVGELLDGPNMKSYAVGWMSGLTNREEIAKRVSPLTYVRAGLPPVLTIHGDADPTVPYTQSVRLHAALKQAGVPNELLTIPGGKHGADCCDLTQRTKAYTTIQAFLRRHGIINQAQTSSVDTR